MASQTSRLHHGTVFLLDVLVPEIRETVVFFVGVRLVKRLQNVLVVVNQLKSVLVHLQLVVYHVVRRP